MQVGDQAEQLGRVPPGDADGVLDHADGQRDAAAGQAGQVGAVGQEIPGPVQRDAVPDADQHVRAGRQHPGDPGRAGEIPVHDPDAVSGEQVRIAFQGLVQQLLLSFSLVPPAAGRGTGRAAGHRQGGAGGCVAEPQLPQLRDTGEESSAVPADPNACPVRRGIGDPGQRPVDRAQASRSPTVTAR